MCPRCEAAGCRLSVFETQSVFSGYVKVYTHAVSPGSVRIGRITACGGGQKLLLLQWFG
jgi:hypothetical protein